MKTLVLDIETSPSLAYVWKLWRENVGLTQLTEAGQMISFAAKWTDKKKVHFFSDFHDGHEAMIDAAYEFVNEADAVVTFNGIQFDMKHLQREFALEGKSPPAPWKDIDLYRVVKSRFRFTSNKLDHVVEQFGLGNKVEVHFELWRDCMAGDPKAWALMRKYNKRDVVLTEQLYLKVLPWIRNHPNVNLFTDEPRLSACPHCGCTRLHSRGTYKALVGQYRRWQCTDCGAWSRTRERIPETTTLRRSV